MNLYGVVRDRVDPVPLTAVVALGDLVCIAVFVFGGAAAGHGFDPVGQFDRVARTYLSFVIGWGLAAFAAGLYSLDARRTPRRALGLVTAAWVAAALVAQGLRATAWFPGDASLAFFLVSVAVGFALLVSWRVVVAWLTGERAT